MSSESLFLFPAGMLFAILVASLTWLLLTGFQVVYEEYKQRIKREQQAKKPQPNSTAGVRVKGIEVRWMDMNADFDGDVHRPVLMLSPLEKASQAIVDKSTLIKPSDDCYYYVEECKLWMLSYDYVVLKEQVPTTGNVTSLQCYEGQVFAVINHKLYIVNGNKVNPVRIACNIETIESGIFLGSDNMAYHIGLMTNDRINQLNRLVNKHNAVVRSTQQISVDATSGDVWLLNDVNNINLNKVSIVA